MLKAAFIGTGGISGAHLGCLKGVQDVEIAALCDVNPENLERRRKEYGGKAYADFTAMLDEVKPDAVWLCTPPQARREPLIACARRGIPVFCEKPVGREAAAVARHAAELKRLKARIAVGYVFRATPSVQRLREAMADDAIHAVQSFYGCPMSLRLSSRAWFYDKAVSGGALVDQATHNLDLLRYLFGEVREVAGVAANPARKKKKGYTIEEVIGVTMRFAKDLIGVHLHSWLAESWRNEIVASGRKRLYRLNLNKGALVIEEGAETRTFQQPATPIHHFENARFLEMVRSGDWSANFCDFADGAASLRLTLACDEAAVKGGTVSLRP